MSTIIENLEALKAAVEAQPESRFDLSRFRNDTPCGTNFCTAGLAASLPQFQALGFRLDATPKDYAPGEFNYTVSVNGIDVYSPVSGDEEDEADAADLVFGARAWQHLFETAGDGELDREIGYAYDWKEDVGNMTDKELAIARLKKQIETLKGEQE
jgi:hypothetical protein